MQNNLLFSLILNISLLVLMATVLTELRPLRLMIKRQERSVYNQLFLGLIFGLLSISCTYTGLSFEGAVVNTRVVSTLAAGLVGGPMSGVCAGLMSGIHRYFYNPAGFTSFACGIGTFGFGVIGALLATWARGLENDVYFQVGLLTVIGLSAKNAMLIVEFANEMNQKGHDLFEATLHACRQRLRPILMTSLAFIFGVLPMATSTGAGSGGQHAVGTGVMGGMISATILAIYFVPLFFVLVRRRFPLKPRPE